MKFIVYFKTDKTVGELHESDVIFHSDFKWRTFDSWCENVKGPVPAKGVFNRAVYPILLLQAVQKNDEDLLDLLKMLTKYKEEKSLKGRSLADLVSEPIRGNHRRIRLPPLNHILTDHDLSTVDSDMDESNLKRPSLQQSCPLVMTKIRRTVECLLPSVPSPQLQSSSSSRDQPSTSAGPITTYLNFSVAQESPIVESSENKRSSLVQAHSLFVEKTPTRNSLNSSQPQSASTPHQPSSSAASNRKTPLANSCLPSNESAAPHFQAIVAALAQLKVGQEDLEVKVTLIQEQNRQIIQILEQLKIGEQQSSKAIASLWEFNTISEKDELEVAKGLFDNDSKYR
jgi:hypothetical protein